MRALNYLFRKARNRAWRATRETYYHFCPDAQLLRKLEQKPSRLTLELTNICNANCVFCAYRYLERPKRVMDGQVFRAAVDEYSAMGGNRVVLTGIVGEPLVDPDVLDRIRYCRSRAGIDRVDMVTNCILLDRVGVEAFVRSGVTSVSVSTTAPDEDMYLRIYRSRQYRRMHANLLELLQVNDRLGRPLRINVSLRIDRPWAEVARLEAMEEIRRLADSVEPNAYYDNWGGRIRQRDLSGTMRLRPPWLMPLRRLEPCRLLYDGIVVLCDGSIVMCGCRDLNADSELGLGRLGELSLAQAYSGAALRALRGRWLTGKGIPRICRDCTAYSPRTYLMLQENAQAFARGDVC